MEPVRLIGVAGRRRHGKDTFGNMLKCLYGYERVAFADAVKQELTNEFCYKYSQYSVCPGTIEDNKEYFRPHLVRIGMDRRGQDPDYWLKASLLKEKMEGNKRCFVVTDVRFQNEIDYIHSLSGKVVFIRREGEPIIDTDESVNAAEKLMPEDCDYTIVNPGSKWGLFMSSSQFIVDIGLDTTWDLYDKWAEG